MTRDFAFEALAEVTGTDWNTGRGELNSGLKSIREQSEVEDSYLLGDLIHARAKMYREVMPDVMLTPTALAKHWRRVLEESAHRNRTQSVNRAAQTTACKTCRGDRFVTVRLRAPMNKVVTDHLYEEVAPCPDCNVIDVSYRRFDGSRFVGMDPAAVREAIKQ